MRRSTHTLSLLYTFSVAAAAPPRRWLAGLRCGHGWQEDFADRVPLARSGLVDAQQPCQRRGQIDHLGLAEVARGERRAQEKDRYIGVIAIEAAVRRAEVVFAILAPERKGACTSTTSPARGEKKLRAMAREAATGGNWPWRSWVRVTYPRNPGSVRAASPAAVSTAAASSLRSSMSLRLR